MAGICPKCERPLVDYGVERDVVEMKRRAIEVIEELKTDQRESSRIWEEQRKRADNAEVGCEALRIALIEAAKYVESAADIIHDDMLYDEYDDADARERVAVWRALVARSKS